MRKLLFIGGTHSNEGFAVDVLRAIEQAYDKAEYGYDWIIGNPRALALGVRFTEKDLNRSAPGDSASPYYEERRAAEIIRLSKGCDAVIDLHGSVADCGIVTIIPYPTVANMELAKIVPVRRNVIWYSPTSAIRGPLAQHTVCPAVEIECGPKADPQIATRLFCVIAAILQANKEGMTGGGPPDQEFYTVYGVQPGAFSDQVQDFRPTTLDGDTFCPFMSNQYPGKLCYKTKPISPEVATQLLTP